MIKKLLRAVALVFAVLAAAMLTAAAQDYSGGGSAQHLPYNSGYVPQKVNVPLYWSTPVVFPYGATITGGTMAGAAITGGAISGGTITGSTISGGTIKGVAIDSGTFWFASTAKCDGSTDDTAAILSALTSAGLVGEPVVLPPGTCMFSSITIPANQALIGQGQGVTTLKRIAGQSSIGITVNSFSVLRSFTIDGNKTAQTAGSCGIKGFQIQGARIEDVTVTNVLGMGDCFQDSARVTHIRETVTNTRRPSSLTGTTGWAGYNGSGFWTASYTQSSFFYDGGSQYIDCVSEFNDLDGMEFGSNNIVIRGGSYDNNGQFTDLTPTDQAAGTHSSASSTQGNLGGALGAAGIYFASGGGSPTVTTDTLITGVRAFNNSESGLDLVLGRGSVVANNTSHDNGTFGILLNGPASGGSVARYIIDGNHTYYNGATTNASWVALNPTFDVHVGIGFTGVQSFAVISNNDTYDDRAGAAQTQRWGVNMETQFLGFGTPAFDHMTFTGNQWDYNATDGTNFDGINRAIPSGVTAMVIVGRFINPTNGYYLNNTQIIDGSNNASFANLALAGTLTPALKTIGGAGLGTCGSAQKGQIVWATDASGATWGSTLTGGGSQMVLAACNGSIWVAH